MTRLPTGDQNNVWYRYNHADAVLVFVHGVLSDSRSCWLSRDEKTGQSRCYWPELIASDARFKDIAIYLSGYHTAVDSGDFPIQQCALEVFSYLKTPDASGHPPVMDKPKITFVCHSMGGIVARYLLCEQRDAFREKQVGIVLIASPSYGSQLAHSLDQIIYLYNHRQGKQLIWSNEFLQDLDQRFKNLKESGHIPHLSGVELFENRFVMHWKWLPWFTWTKVVTEESAARYFGYAKQVGGSDHNSICKPQAKEDRVHQYLLEFLQDKALLPSQALPVIDTNAGAAAEGELPTAPDISHARMYPSLPESPPPRFPASIGVAPPVASMSATSTTTVGAESQHRQELRAIKQRRLQLLERQAATYGLNCPPEITIQIEDLRREIAELNSYECNPVGTDPRLRLFTERDGIRPRINPSLSPRFYDLDQDAFRNLCCELFARQSGIATCDAYGRREPKRQGIDLLARRSGGAGIEVGQCQCVGDLSPDEIRDTSDKFFEHLAYWQQRDVRRFLLFVACELDRTQQQDAIGKQVERFAQHGITYEAWSSTTLRLQLAPHVDIVQRHIPSREWVENICENVVPTTPGSIASSAGLTLMTESLSLQVERLFSSLSKTVAEQLDEIRERYREGKKHEAYERVQALQRGESWTILEKPLQARILRVLATYTLNLHNDAATARDLANRARGLDPSGDDTVLRTMLTYQTEGAESALRELGIPTTLDTINLEIALLLLELRGRDEVLAKLTYFPRGVEPNAETRRLHALALLTRGDLVGAQTHIQLALAEHSTWEDIRIAGAIINYCSVLAPTVLPPHIMLWPIPVDWPFVRRDTQSLERLRQAKEEFEALATLSEDDGIRGLFEIWCLACLANDPDRQAEAQTFCCHLLEKNLTNHRAVVWALARNYTVSLHASERALEDLIEDHNDEHS